MNLFSKHNLLIILYLFLGMFVSTFLWLVRENSTGIPVLNYHQVNNESINALTVPVEVFAQEMAYLKSEGYHTITPDQLTDYLQNHQPLPDKPVLITFDDGYKDNYINAFPILRENNFQATIFIISDYMGRFDNYLSWSEVKEMQEGGIYFGSHTLSHYQLPPLDDHQLQQQLQDSKIAIEWNILNFSDYIAYPCGSFNDRILQKTAEYGYKGGFTVKYGLVQPGDNPYIMNRVPIFGNSPNDLLKFKLRLKYAPIFGPLERFRTKLSNSGLNFLARLIIVP